MSDPSRRAARRAASPSSRPASAGGRRAAAAPGRQPGARRTGWPLAIDCLAMVALLIVAVLGFGPAFGGTGWMVAAGGGILLGLAIALLSVAFRWNVFFVVLGTIVAYFVFGSALAVPSRALLGVIPTGQSLRDLVLGIVFSWKDVLTLQAPVGGFPSTLVVPFLSTLVASVMAITFAVRFRRAAAWALLPATALLVTAIVFGTKETAAPLVQGLVFAGVALGWWAWRRFENRAEAAAGTAVTDSTKDAARLRSVRLATGAGLLVVAMGVGLTAAAVTPMSTRDVLRDQIVPPLDLHDYASPLVGFRKYVRDDKDVTLFTVKGLPDGARVRLATLDQYDGIVYNVAGDGSSGSGTFSRISDTIPSSGAQGQSASIDVTVDDYSGVWIPDAGYLDSFQFEGPRAQDLAESLHYNSVTGVALTTLGLQSGDSYSFDTVIPAKPNDEQLERKGIDQLSLPKSNGVPDEVTALAIQFAGEAQSPIAEVRNIETSLSQGGFFSHGLEGEATSRAGHGAERIASLVGADQMIGDDEQYAVTMALMVRSLGMPARVVMGFYPKEYAGQDAEQPITGDDVHAWVEVPFQGVGWVAFDPTPPEDQVPLEEAPKPKSDPKAQVLQPPPPPQEPAELPPDIRTDDTDQDPIVTTDWTWVLVLGIGGGILVLALLLLAPVVLIGLLKARRRKQRRFAPVPADRVSGGWDEIVDRAGDFGTRSPRGVTRRENALVLESAYPAAGIGSAARSADSAVFGPGDPTPEQVDAFWSEVDSIVASMAGSKSAWQRLRARLSLRSFQERAAERRAQRAARRTAARAAGRGGASEGGAR
ncbi:transglutaminaseTgpA domain-containing protein [Cnuibacter physcomitrellae]|nr:transglutaminase domain-containing protein [Cnuibacter physcomitrellae]